jgi:hypothetical protein
MSYSKTHQRFADNLRNQRALSHPDEFLGPNWKEVLNFWLYLDTLSEDQLEIIERRDQELYSAESWNFYEEAAEETIGEDIYYGAYWAVLDSTVCRSAATYATIELIGAHKILEQGKELKIVQLFLEPRTNVSVPLIEVTQTASLVTSFQAY